VTREFARHGGGEYEGVPLDDEKQSMRAWFGFAEPFDWRKRNYLGPFISVVGTLIVGGLFFLAIAAAFKLLGSAVFGSLPNGAGSSFGLTGIIVAMIGAPFVVWRAFVAQKQVDVAEQGQITDRLNKAIEGLGAEKTVKDAGGESTEPNLEVRIGAIYALERIAQDSPRDHIQIMEILCAYIRENAPLRQTPKNLFETCAEDTAERPDADTPKMPDWSEMYGWANTLPKPRTDIQVALEVIGRRAPRQITVERDATVRGSKVGYRLDLRSTCLQGADLSELEFTHGLFNQAQLQGAHLSEAQLQGADLGNANLSWANLRHAKLQKTNLGNANLHRANLSHAKLQSANLRRAELQGAKVWHSKFDTETNFAATKFQGAAVKSVDFADATIKRYQLHQMFGDASVILPDGHGPDHESWPKHWSKEKLHWKYFDTEWHAFQRSIGQDPENPT